MSPIPSDIPENQPAPPLQKSRGEIGQAILWIIAIVLSSLLGRALSFLPNNASPLWPPTGLAFAVILLSSYRKSPVAWLGIFLSNVPFYYNTGGSSTTPFDVPSCLIASTGTTAQAMAGVWLVKRFVSTSIIDWKIRDYCKGLLLAGPLACCIGPTIGSSILLISESIPAQAYINTWVLWWFGDSFGVLVVGGLFLYLWQSKIRAQNEKNSNPKSDNSVSNEHPHAHFLPTSRSRQWHIFSIVILVTMLGITLATWKLFINYLNSQDNERFIRLSKDSERLISSRLSTYEDILKGVRGYIDGSQLITIPEWHEYISALDLRQEYPGIIGVVYAAKVSRNEIPQYLDFVRKNIAPNFSIRDFPTQQKDSSYTDQFIAQYIEPQILQAKGLGLDIGADPERRKAAEIARDTGTFSISRKLHLYQLDQPGFLLFLPVYKKGSHPLSVEARRQFIQGWVYAPLIGSTLFEETLKHQSPEVTFSVYDGEITPEHLIFQDKKQHYFRGQKRVVHRLAFADKTWTIEWLTTREFASSPNSIQPTLVLFGGLMFTLLLGVLLINLNSTRDRAIQYANQVSEELIESNTKLHSELIERQKIETELRGSREQLDLALLSTNDGLWDWNVSTGEVYFSPRWITMLGYNLDEIKPHFSSWAYLLHPDDEPLVSQVLNAHLNGERPDYQVEIRMQSKSGEWKWVLTRGQVVARDMNGKAIRMVGTHTDITERKRIEEQLKTSGKRLKQAISSSAQGLWDWNIQTDELFIDQSWFDLFGYDPSLASGKMNMWHATVHKKDFKKVVHALNRHFKELDSICDVEYRLRNGDGQWVWVCSRGQVIEWDENNKPLRMIGTTQDITQRKKLEVNLIEAIARAEQANQYKSNFLANMSHEIRTPMNGILGMTEITLNTELNGDQRHYLEMVYSSAQSLLVIINDILDFSKIEAGKLSLEPIPFKLRTLISETLYPMQDMARKKNLSISGELADDVPELIIGDPTRLRQVLNNLISNAIKFTSIGEIKLGIDLENTANSRVKLHFWVSDTGIGLTQEQQKRIFDPFMQGDNSTSRKFGGTGLGLSISSQLVEMMQGKLWVESEPTRGSTFHFTATFTVAKGLLPEQNDSGLNGSEVIEIANTSSNNDALQVCLTDNNQPGTFSSLKPNKALSILLAEDNTINQAVAAHILKEQGHQVTIAGNGNQAIQLWEDQPFDIILMDMHMPSMDGVEATQHIRKKEEKSGMHIPIIAVTASALKGDRDRCLAAGMDDYVSKPYRKDELIAVLQRVSARFLDNPVNMAT